MRYHGAVLDLLVPPRCAGCGARAPRTPCATCDARGLAAPHPGCERCGGPRTVGHGCWPASAPIASTRVAFDYRGPIASAVACAKLRGGRAAWGDLADSLAGRVAHGPPSVDAVVPVPTPPRRARRRGVDHTAVLAAALAARLGVPAVHALRPPPDRSRGAPPVARGPLAGSAVLLVDDVVTTGATALAAALALRDAGAGEIHLAAVARAGDHHLAG